MSSALVSALAAMLQNDYSSVAAVAAISYDYILTIPDEIEYIWNQPWTWISVLFLVVRYIGLLFGILTSLIGVSFMPISTQTCSLLNNVANWTLVVFMTSADLSMILRLYALYGRSKFILAVLTLIYVPGVVLSTLTIIMESIPNSVVVVTGQFLNFSTCLAEYSGYRWGLATVILQFLLSAVMLLLVIIQFGLQSFRMYRATKQWEFNKYTSLFAREGILYFLSVLVLYLSSFLIDLGVIADEGWLGSFLFIISTVPVVTLTPRFIMNVRILYARDVGGQFHPASSGPDIGFGSSSRGYLRQSASTTVGSITFASSNAMDGGV